MDRLFFAENAVLEDEANQILSLEFVSVEKPVTGGKGVFVINHPLLNFWFRFFYKNVSSYKRREKSLINKIKDNTNAYIGRRFEAVCHEFLENQRLGFDKTGRWWGAYRDTEGDRKVAEIDLVSINEQSSEILFAECKWQDKVDAKKILAELKGKVHYVEWHKDKRKERYAIFAKSFKEKIKEPDLMLFDLKDFQALLEKPRMK